MKNFLSFFLSFFLIFNHLSAQNTAWPTTTSSNAVGIGTTNPFARLHVFDGNNTTLGSSVLFEGTVGSTPTSGAGTRLMWIPEKAAFRVGRVSNTMIYQGQTANIGLGDDFWDNANIGEYSFASGLSNLASGYASNALGIFNRVEGDFSTSIGLGNHTLLSGYAIGESNNVESNEFSVAVGSGNQIYTKGYAFGYTNTLNNGQNGLAIGGYNTVNASNAMAFGTNLLAMDEDVMVFGKQNLGLTNNPAFEFGIGNGTPKNALTIYQNGGIQFNELGGVGDYLTIDNAGNLSRTDITIPNNNLWQENTTSEIYYEDDVTIGQVNVNRPSDAKLWVDGMVQANGVKINNPNTGWFNDPSQSLHFVTMANKSFAIWGGDDIVENELQFRFKSNFATGQPWNDPLGQLAFSVVPTGIKGGTTTGSLNIFTNYGYLELGPQNTNYCHFNTNRPKYYFNKQLVVNSGIFSSHTNQNVQLQTNGTSRLTILNSNGNVGIGNTNPSEKLEVMGNAKISGAMYIGSQKMTFPPDQNSLLHVNGKAVFREAVVRPDGWADFVFDENYKLLPLEEVKAYIEENKHLPNVPSETEVKEQGVSLGNMDAILLQKIEELTLYVLQLEEEIKSLKNE